MLNFLAESLNEIGNRASNKGMRTSAKFLYRFATAVRQAWSNPWYNLGFQAKDLDSWELISRLLVWSPRN